MPESPGHHHSRRKTDAGLHFGLARDEVMPKTEAVVNAVVDAFQGAAPMIAIPPGGIDVGGGYEDAPVLPGDRVAHDASVISRTDLAGLVALALPLTFEAVSRCRMSSSLCVLPDPETAERVITTYRQRGKARWELKAVISTIRNPAVELRGICGLSIRLKTHRQSNLPAYIPHPGKLRSRKSYTVARRVLGDKRTGNASRS
jgi:hypothetical protein